MRTSDAGGSRAALVLATVLLAVFSLAGAGRAEAAGTASPPAPPAVYTTYLVAVTNIQGDFFHFEREGRTMTIRLRDADSSDLAPTRRQSAMFLAAQLLEAEPFWIFPCAPLNPGAPGEVQARVWTKKGWLSEILIKSNLAKRRSDVAAVTFTPAEAPSAAAAADVPPPPPPAFAAPIQQIVAGDTFEVQREGKTVRLRLYDAACAGGADRAKELAARTLGTGPVWIFPSSQRKLDAGDDLPVRIWTARGWLADVLVSASAARYHPDPDKALEERLPASPLQERAKPASAAEPKSGGTMIAKFVWHRVSVTAAQQSTHSIRTDLFMIPFLGIAHLLEPEASHETLTHRCQRLLRGPGVL
ncbi:MAG TPA: hypothetical protein VFH53_10600 [Phycisphaerae bacterium]|nr:hypothetical protein [Phycisphaerae bacterium]